MAKKITFFRFYCFAGSFSVAYRYHGFSVNDFRLVNLLLCYEIRKVRREGKSRWYFVFFVFSGHFSFSWSGFIFDFDFGLSLLFLSVLLVFAWWL